MGDRLSDELEKCRSMKAGDMKKELEGLGISTKSFFEKTDFVKALAEARVDGIGKKKKRNDEEGYAEYTNVEVLTDDASGPRPQTSQQQKAQQQPPGGGGGGSPFGGGGSGGNPFAGMGGMGNIADMFKNAGGGGAGAGNPFGGAGAGAADPMAQAQKMMHNPKIMAAMQECMSNPAAFAKYQNDPEVSELIQEL